MKIENINDKIKPAVKDALGCESLNPYSMVALSLSIQELLTHLKEETLNMECTLNSGIDSSETAGAKETSTTQSTSSSATSSSPYGDVSSWTVACVMAALVGDNNELQSLLAKNELDLTGKQNDMLNGQVKEAQDDFDKWMKNYDNQKNAEAHKSRWQKFCNVFKTAFNEVVKVMDKYNPIILAEDWAETKLENALGVKNLHLCKLETQMSLVKEGLNQMNQGLTQGLNIAAKFLAKNYCAIYGGDEEKWEKAFEVILPVIAAIATAVATFGVGEALEGAGAAVEVAEIADESAQAASMTQKAMSAVKQAFSFVKNLSRSQTAAVFMLTNRLQNNGFTQNFAKACTNDPAKQEYIEMALNTTLSLIGTVAGFQCASSFLPKESEFFTSNLYKWVQRLQYLETASSAVGSIGVGKCDIDLSKFQQELGDLNSAITGNNTFMEMTEQSIQQLQSTMSFLLTSLGDNVSSLAKAMPKEMAAGAAAI